MIERDLILLVGDLLVLPAQVVLVLPLLSSSFVTGDLVLDGGLNARSRAGRCNRISCFLSSASCQESESGNCQNSISARCDRVLDRGGSLQTKLRPHKTEAQHFVGTQIVAKQTLIMVDLQLRLLLLNPCELESMSGLRNAKILQREVSTGDVEILARFENAVGFGVSLLQ